MTRSKWRHPTHCCAVGAEQDDQEHCAKALRAIATDGSIERRKAQIDRILKRVAS